MGKLVVFDHPLMSHKLSIIRDEKTGTKDFRQSVEEIANLMAYEATRDLPTVEVDIKTPCGIAKCKQLAKKVVIVPILRAGIGMVSGLLKLMPAAIIFFSPS